MDKLPIGVKPHKLWLEERAAELKAAIKRYNDDNRIGLLEWHSELQWIERILEHNNHSINHSD